MGLHTTDLPVTKEDLARTPPQPNYNVDFCPLRPLPVPLPLPALGLIGSTLLRFLFLTLAVVL